MLWQDLRSDGTVEVDRLSTFQL